MGEPQRDENVPATCGRPLSRRTTDFVRIFNSFQSFQSRPSWDVDDSIPYCITRAFSGVTGMGSVRHLSPDESSDPTCQERIGDRRR
jgi:hypothetical protein